MGYKIEHAKSGRGKCKKCKEKIGQGELRLGAEFPGKDDSFSVVSWYHPACFQLPRKLKVTAEEFVQEHLEDESGEILPDKAEEIAAAIASKKPKAGKKDNAGSGSALIDQLKAEFEDKKRKADDEVEDKPAKKAKKGEKDAGDDEHERALELYETYHKMALEPLKDILRWNGQVLKGTKAIVLHKVIDGALHGRLMRCTCEGKLKLNDTCDKVICSGTFDEEYQSRIPCDLTYAVDDRRVRALPWFTEEPTEEEKEKMEAELSGEAVDDDSDLGKLMKGAEGLEFNFKDKKAANVTVKKVIEFLDGKLDLPEDEKKKKMAVGKLFMANQDKSPSELIKLLADKYPLVEGKADKKAAKEEAASVACNVPANAALMLAFDELAGLYFKEGNRNAGSTYKKAVKAVKDLDVEVTAKNALSFGKAGPSKLDGVGAGTAKKMKEFCETGTIAKLEEKRAEAAP